MKTIAKTGIMAFALTVGFAPMVVMAQVHPNHVFSPAEGLEHGVFVAGSTQITFDATKSGNTTQIPVYYAIQALKSLGLSASWNGVDNFLSVTNPNTTSSKISTSGVTGNHVVMVNGKSVGGVTPTVGVDPFSGHATAYVTSTDMTKILDSAGVKTTTPTMKNGNLVFSMSPVFDKNGSSSTTNVSVTPSTNTSSTTGVQAEIQSMETNFQNEIQTMLTSFQNTVQSILQAQQQPATATNSDSSTITQLQNQIDSLQSELANASSNNRNYEIQAELSQLASSVTSLASKIGAGTVTGSVYGSGGTGSTTTGTISAPTTSSMTASLIFSGGGATVGTTVPVQISYSGVNSTDSLVYVITENGTQIGFSQPLPASGTILVPIQNSGVNSVSVQVSDLTNGATATTNSISVLGLTPSLAQFSVSLTPSATTGEYTVTTSLTSSSNQYFYATSATAPTTPTYGENLPSGTLFLQSSIPVSILSNDYVTVYEINSTDQVVGWGTTQNTSTTGTTGTTGTTTGTLAQLNVQIEAGSALGTTSVNLLSLTQYSNNTLYYAISPTTPVTPTYGESVGNIAGVSLNSTNLSTSAGETFVVYEVDSNNDVIGFETLPISSSDVAQSTPNLTTTPTASAGSIANTTTINATPDIAGASFQYQVSTSSIQTPILYSNAGSYPNSGVNLAVSAGDYVGVYELNSSDQVAKFSQIQITSSEIMQQLANTLSNVSLVASSDVVGDTSLSSSTQNYYNGDNLYFTVTPSTPSIPVMNENITNISNTTTNQVNIPAMSGYSFNVYETSSNGSGDVIGFASVPITSSDVAVAPPALTVVPTASPSMQGVGYTQISATPNVSGDTLQYQISSTPIAPPVLNGMGNQNPSSSLSAVSGDYVGVYEYNSSNQIVAFSQIQLTSSEISQAPPTLTVAPTATAPVTLSQYATTNMSTTPNTSGDVITYVTQDSGATIATPPTPVNGETLSNYVSSINTNTGISGYASATNSQLPNILWAINSGSVQIGVIETNSSGVIDGYSLFTLPNASATALQLGVPTFTTGSVTGTIDITPVNTSVSTLVSVTSTQQDIPAYGSALPANASVQETNVPITAGEWVNVYQVNSNNQVVGFVSTQYN